MGTIYVCAFLLNCCLKGNLPEAVNVNFYNQPQVVLSLYDKEQAGQPVASPFHHWQSIRPINFKQKITCPYSACGAHSIPRLYRSMIERNAFVSTTSCFLACREVVEKTCIETSEWKPSDLVHHLLHLLCCSCRIPPLAPLPAYRVVSTCFAWCTRPSMAYRKMGYDQRPRRLTRA